jgi:hypothetical protein
MSQQQLLARVVSVLDAEGVPYMITGSLVSSFQGAPRATHDIDLVVAISPPRIPALLNAFPPPDYYLDELAIRDAVARKDMFNLLQVTTGDKIDFWLVTDDPFDQSRFARRQPTDIMGMRMVFSAPEDTILQKLKWSKLSGGSEKQFTDALRVYELQRAKLDLPYINDWAARLGVTHLWQRIHDEAQPLS